MSSVFVHAACAVPFLLAGEWAGAVACVAPDLTWAAHEWRYRRSDARTWEEWVQRPHALLPSVLYAYRLAHSWVVVGVALLLLSQLYPAVHWGAVALGYYSHLFLDLFTHYGALAQRPFFPLHHWRWRWTIRKE